MAHPKATKILRATVAQEARIILGPTDGWRKVQVVLPDSPKVFLALDVFPSIIASEGRARQMPLPPSSPDALTLNNGEGGAVGWDRNYKMPEFTSGRFIEYQLAPGQWLTAQAGTGLAVMALIIEWMDEP